MSLSIEALRRSNIMDPEYKAAVEANPIPDLGHDPITQRARRAAWLAQQRELHETPGPIPEVSERDAKILMRDGEEITIRIYTPKPELVPAGGSPLYVAYHEGGFTAGDLTDEELNCRVFAKELGCVCVNVEYRLAPEHQFPTWINDSWDALRWIAKHASKLGATPSQGFVIGGASAGGNISSVLAPLARDEKLSPPLTGVYLCVPALLNPEKIPEKYQDKYLSGAEGTHDPVLKIPPGMTLDAVFKMIQSATGYDMESPLFIPLENKKGLEGFPPTYFEVAGMDPLRDHGLIFEALLKDAGVPTKLTLHEEYGHMFWMNYPTLSASKRAAKERLEGVRWLLEQSKA